MAKTDTALGFVAYADQQRFEYLWASQLRTRAMTDEQFAQAVLTAERHGMEVRGNFSYSESKALMDVRSRGI